MKIDRLFTHDERIPAVTKFTSFYFVWNFIWGIDYVFFFSFFVVEFMINYVLLQIVDQYSGNHPHPAKHA